MVLEDHPVIIWFRFALFFGLWNQLAGVVVKSNNDPAWLAVVGVSVRFGEFVIKDHAMAMAIDPPSSKNQFLAGIRSFLSWASCKYYLACKGWRIGSGGMDCGQE